MILDLLEKLIPKSIKAGIALLICVILTPTGFNGAAEALVGQRSGVATVISWLLLLMGLSAGVVFYYLQSVATNKQNGMSVLHDHYKTEAEEHRIRSARFSVPQFPEDESHKN